MRSFAGVERMDHYAGLGTELLPHDLFEGPSDDPAVHETADAFVLPQVALVVLVQGHHRGDVAADPGKGSLEALVIAEHQQVWSMAA